MYQLISNNAKVNNATCRDFIFTFKMVAQVRHAKGLVNEKMYIALSIISKISMQLRN